MADIYQQKQWELDSAIDDLYVVASRYEDYKNEVNRFIDCVIDDEIAYRDERNKLQQRIDKAIEDINFCLKSVEQESEMSTDERTRKEMMTCNQILKETLDNLKGSDN